MNEITQLIDLLTKKEKLVVMLAPSFPIVYKYPNIIGKLKRLGFSFVIEVSAGAQKTNEELVQALKNDPNARFIAAPCPSIVRLIRTKYPNLQKYLALTVDSPMVATAKIAKEKWPDYKIVFIGPCIAKKLESKEDYPDLNILVLTFKEMGDVFNNFQIVDNEMDIAHDFDIHFSDTRTYPLAAGLTKTSGVEKILSADQLQEVSGWQKCKEALDNFETNTQIRLLDILFCEGGCINGPGINSQLSAEERKNKILEYCRSNSG